MQQNNTFGDRLIELREKKGLSRQKVADELGISRASLEYYEKGKRKPDIDVLLLLADYYGVTCDYLLKGIATENVSINREIGLSDEAIDNLKLFAQEKSALPVSKRNYVSKIDIINFFLSKLFAVNPLQALENLEQIANLKCKGTENVNDDYIEKAYAFLHHNKKFNSKRLHIMNNSTFRNFLISDTSSTINSLITQFSIFYAPTDTEEEFNLSEIGTLNQEKIIEYNKTKFIDRIKTMSLYTEDGNDNGKHKETE